MRLGQGRTPLGDSRVKNKDRKVKKRRALLGPKPEDVFLDCPDAAGEPWGCVEKGARVSEGRAFQSQTRKSGASSRSRTDVDRL